MSSAMKAMLSQPMRDKTEEEIIATRDKAIAYLTSQGYDVVNTKFTDEWYSQKSMDERGVVNVPLCFLAKSLEAMSQCNCALFVQGWSETRGCVVEYIVAKKYELDIIMETEPGKYAFYEKGVGAPPFQLILNTH